MIKDDYIVVGSGLTGSVIARILYDAGREVVVLERRSVAGGNVIDAVHEPSGIRYGVHGPHFFRCSCKRIWEFATRFGDFWHYEHRVLSSIDGELVPWPPQRFWIERIAGKDWRPEFAGTPRNFEEAALSLMPREIFNLAVQDYSTKQWGKPCTELSASLCKRFDIRDGETRLTPNAKHQGIPKDGYTAWMTNMLKGIPIVTGFDYLARREEVQARRLLVFTGPVDEFFGFQLGRLEYRAQRREHQHIRSGKQFLPVAQVNFPQRQGKYGDKIPRIRTIEWRQLMPNPPRWEGLLTEETPYSPTDPDAYEYPFPDEANDRLRAAYREVAKTLPDVIFAGRLGRGIYLDMDQSISHGMVIARNVLKNYP